MGQSNPTPVKLADAIRALAMDAVQQANSGHPGAPMGMAEMAQALFTRHLQHNPADPAWANRDRFVLSNGHGSMLLYALLHLTGYDLPLEELRKFRQLHSKTPGHPEVGITPGVETTTGPLGQGLANAVGMALTEALLAAEFNRPEHTIVDHHTYAFVGDGCLMEGISHEVCSLAGTLRLSKLIVLYDDNGISIDGKVENWFADDTAKRFEGYGWNIVRVGNGHDVDAVDHAIKQAQQLGKQNVRPTLVLCRTVIGKGAPNVAGTDKVHGAPLGADEIAEHAPPLVGPMPRLKFPSLSIKVGINVSLVRKISRHGKKPLMRMRLSIRSKLTSLCAVCVAKCPLVLPMQRANCSHRRTRKLRPLHRVKHRKWPSPHWLSYCQRC